MLVKDYILSVIGKRFCEDGQGNGWDCWAMVRDAYHKCFRLELPDLSYGVCSGLSYPEAQEKFGLMNDFMKIKPGREQQGDILVLRGKPCHVSMVVMPGLMLHVDQGVDTCVESYKSVVWNRRIVGIYRHAQLAI